MARSEAMPKRGVLLAVLLAGCGAEPRRETIPYRFRQSMLAEEATDPGPSRLGLKHRDPPAARAARPRRHQPRLARCERLHGRVFAGSRLEATLAMLRACLGSSLPDDAPRGGLRLRRSGPRVGDLVLFHDTRDANGNRKLDDRFTDCGIVTRVQGGHVRFVYLHPRSGRVKLGALNLRQPNRRRLSGAAIQNTYLRVRRRADPPQTRYLAGQLLAGFATWSGERL